MAKILVMTPGTVKDIDDELQALTNLQSVIKQRVDALAGLWRKLRERAKTDGAIETAFGVIESGSPDGRPALELAEECLEALDKDLAYLQAEVEDDFKYTRAAMEPGASA